MMKRKRKSSAVLVKQKKACNANGKEKSSTNGDITSWLEGKHAYFVPNTLLHSLLTKPISHKTLRVKMVPLIIIITMQRLKMSIGIGAKLP